MENVLRIKVLRGGTHGAEVTFTKNELKSGVTWENSVDKEFSWPVQGAFKKKVKSIGPLLAKILGLDDASEFYGTGYELKPNGYFLKADRLYHVGGKTYVVKFVSFPITPDCENYKEVDDLVKSLVAELETYASTETRVDTRQMVMDMIEQGEVKLPKELEGRNIEDVEDPELLEQFKKALHKRGVVTIDVNEEPEVEDLIAEDEGFSDKKIRVA